MRKLRRNMRRLAALAAGAVAGTAAAPAMGQLLGNQLFPANNAWNEIITNAPIATNSASVISNIGPSVSIHPDWGDDDPANGTNALYGIPYNVVHGNTATKINVIIDNYPGESDLVPAPVPANAVIEGDYQNGPNPFGPGYGTNQRGDSHLLVYDEDGNIAYEFFGTTRPADTVDFNGNAHTDGEWHAASETVWNFNTNVFRPLGYTSGDAAGLSILAGLARPDEGLPANQGGKGAINHALRMTLASKAVTKQYIYPASHMVGGSGNAIKALPMGARMRLQNNPTVNNLISNMTPQAQIIAHAMQQYGLILADIGSSMYVTGTSASMDANDNIQLKWNMNDVLTLSRLKASNFDVITLKPIVTSLTASNGPAGSSLTVNGKNFSGAEGRISVFFGNTNHPAGAVNVLGDSQISVTVPAGSGTVDITVQSGTNELDLYSDSPAANTNTPIFGYGISVTNAFDKFTYGAPLPAIQHVRASGKNIIFSGVNNSGSSGTFHVLTSTNPCFPLANWMVLTNGSFDSSGNFSFTNTATATNSRLFYTLRVP